jgi:hypothetical protein
MDVVHFVSLFLCVCVYVCVYVCVCVCKYILHCRYDNNDITITLRSQQLCYTTLNQGFSTV